MGAATEGSKNRFCYFIQNHRAAPQVARLVATLKRLSPGAQVLVGHDGRGAALTRAELPDLPGVDLFTVRGPVERGELSLLSPYFQAIERLADAAIDYDWLVYLSSQDYPTRPLAESESRLVASERDGFLLWWDAFAPETPWGRKRQGRRRYGYRYYRPPAAAAFVLRPLKLLNGIQSLIHVQPTYGLRVGVRRRTPFRDGFVCYAGTQWTTLRRPCVDFLAGAMQRERALIDYYARTICPDESLVQTLLVNSGSFRLENDSLRFVDMAGTRDGSPRCLRPDDFERLVSGPYQFARKFDAATGATLLDRLDAYLFAGADGSRTDRNEPT